MMRIPEWRTGWRRKRSLLRKDDCRCRYCEDGEGDDVASDDAVVEAVDEVVNGVVGDEDGMERWVSEAWVA